MKANSTSGHPTATAKDGSKALLAPLPAWSRPNAGRGADVGTSCLEAGVALAALDGLARSRPDWLGLFAMRQALDAAEMICRLLRLGATREQLRDEAHWRRPAEAATESGIIHALLRHAAARGPIGAGPADILRAFGLADDQAPAAEPPDRPAEPDAAELRTAPTANPLEEAIAAARGFHADHAARLKTPADQRALDGAMLLIADQALARRLAWPRVLALLSTADPALFRDAEGKRLRPDQPDFTATAWAGYAVALHAAWDNARRLAPRAEALRTAKLRTKGRAGAIAAVLADDSVSAPSLTMLGSERAAYRMLDGLTARGALRELTGRRVFRLYGV